MRPTPPLPAGREPLPRDPGALPPMGQVATDVLASGLRAMSLDLPAGALAGIDAQLRLLAAWGQHVNLTAIREPTDVIRLHVLDSLAAVAPVRERLGTIGSLVDIGSGGGYPGIPLGLALGVTTLSLVESVGRKARFLEVAGQAAADAARRADPAHAPGVEVLAERSEALAAGGRRASWDVATVRAVGSMAECAELGLPLLRTGGLLVCWKRDRDADDAGADGLRTEVDAARPLVRRLGGGDPEVVPAGVPGAPGHRLVMVRKERATPDAYPRPPVARRAQARS